MEKATSKKVKQICLIDDDPIFTKMLQRLITLHDFSSDFISFNNGKKAMDFYLEAQAEAPDMILLDLNMPVMDGWQFLDALTAKNIHKLSKTPIYVVTSSVHSVDVERAAAINRVKEYVVKPITLDNLVKLLQNTFLDNGKNIA